MGRYIAVGGTIYLDFSTQTLAGVKATLSGTPVISAYKDDSLVQTTAGITLTVDHDGITGCNVVKVDTSADGTFYSSGAQIRLRITTGTVDSINVAGDPVGEFTMGVENSNVVSMDANTLTASALATDAVTEIQSGLATSAALATIDDFLDTEIAAILEDTGTTLPAQIAALFTSALTESYRATGATGTAAQLLYEIIAHLGESSIAGTTKTLKKLDGSTTAKTYTLDDATNPTSITETT